MTPGHATAPPGERPAPLGGVRVLEISHSSAAVAGRLLADLGAEVIKIEPPGGEPARHTEPTCAMPDGGSVSLFWLSFNVSKKSVCLDLGDPSGTERFTELARTADIVVTDFQRLDPAQNDALAASARAANPALVWAEIWPYGRGLPHVQWPASDLVLQAMGGHLQLNGDEDRRPVRLGLPAALLQGGSEAAAAALMAYYHRLRTGAGQRVDVSIQECITWTLLNTSMTWQLLHRDEVRGGDVRKERANKFYTRLVWRCRDGYVQFGPVGGGGGAVREKSYAALVAWMAEHGIHDPLLTERDWNGRGQFAIGQDDYDAVTAIIADFMATRTVDEVMARAVPSGILVAPVNDLAQILASPHFAERGLFTDLADPWTGTQLRYPSNWVRMTDGDLRPLTPAPTPGADTADVLGALPAPSRAPAAQGAAS